ncbi:ankyrin repeat and SAM domain-containing protein 6 [Iris pallida]|uniref:Ankyrin repeat and SAM domain-containing protein 6 n=1 Tax=Iris pallida TaxID=29817 RepID=A0AAX6H5K6_IRIPA|nr:ankyrin repeat and SAM domain-containing protein 6 [Iris pallida]
MYADRVAAGGKRSIRDRLDGNVADDFSCNRSSDLKRQRQNDDKWKHDLYEDAKGPQVSSINRVEVGAKDLRLKLQKKSSQQAHQGGRESGVRDLREKLSGSLKSQLTNTDPPKAKVILESVKPIKKVAAVAEATAANSKKVSLQTTSSKKSQQKSESSVDGLLSSLGLEKYSIQFQAEEIDMQALTHMTDEDLKALGVPMGPRKKILLALDSRA